MYYVPPAKGMYQLISLYRNRIDSSRLDAMSGGMRVYRVPDAASATSSAP